MKGLSSLCLSGITALYWSGATSMLMDMHPTHGPIAFCLTLCFLVGVLLMITGGITATFPANAPCKMGISGLGAWMALIFTLASFHLGSFKLHKDPVYSVVSVVICFILITTFWGIVAQDPVVLHIFAKFVVWFVCKIIDYVHLTAPFFQRWLRKARDVINPLTLKLVAVYHMARYFLPDGPPFLPESFLTNVTKKDYEKNYHGKSKQEFEGSRVAEYLASCVSGLMCMYWSDAVTTVTALNMTHPQEAFVFVIYFTVALVLMLIGVIAGTFPSSCPCKMGFTGLGALQAVQFIVATYHIATLKLFLEPIYFWISLSVSTTFITIFWGLVVQDPILVHVLAKLVVWSCCYMVYGFYRLGYNIFSMVGTAWACLFTQRRPKRSSNPTLQAHLLGNRNVHQPASPTAAPQQASLPPPGP